MMISPEGYYEEHLKGKNKRLHYFVWVEKPSAN